MTDPMLDLGRRVLAAQPFSRLLGAELLRFDREGAEIRLPLREDLLQQNGFAHGGVLAYLADNALTYAGGGALDGPVITSDFTISYLRPAVGEALLARAWPLRAGARQAVCRCDVLALSEGRERLCAAAQGVIVRVEGG
jgi:uncharacterized protein (TIGR00369 family)